MVPKAMPEAPIDGDENVSDGPSAPEYLVGLLRTRVLPRKELEEERVVVSQRLTGGSRPRRGLSRSGEFVELGVGLSSLVLHGLGDGAWDKVSAAPVCVDRSIGACRRRLELARTVGDLVHRILCSWSEA
jgi:hypothetical protein